MAEAAGWSVLPVTVSMSGINKQLNKQLVGPSEAAAKKSGDAIAKGVKAGADSAAKAVEKASEQQERARDRATDAADKTRLAELKLSEVMDKGEASASQIATATQGLEKARRDEARAVGMADKATKNLESAQDNLRKAQEQSADAGLEVSASMKDITDNADGAGGSLDGLVGKLGGLAGAAAGIAGVGSLIADGFDMSGTLDNMNRQLGLTGDAAAALGDEVGQVLRSGVAGGVDEAAEAVGTLHSQFGYLGFEGEQTAAELSDNFLAFSQTFGVDMSEAVQTAGQLVTNGLAPDVESAADLMTAAMQRVPAAMRDEMPEIINEYGTHFRALGFSGEEAFSMLVAQADKGKWALDKTGDALKEFTIRASDGSKATGDAYAAIGEDAEAMATSVAAGGDSARLALQYTAESLLEVEDPAERAQHAIALFGTPLEDLSVDQIPQFLESLSAGTGEMAGFAGSSQDLADSVSNSLQGRLDALKGTVQDLAGDAFMKLWDIVQPITEWAKNNQTWLTPLAIGLGTMAGVLTAVGVGVGVWAAAQALLNVQLFASPITWIVAAVVGLAAALTWVLTQTEWGQAVWSGFVDVLKGAWSWISGVFIAGWEAASGFLSSVWDGMKAGWDVLWQGIQTAWNSVLKPVLDAIWSVVSTTLGVIGTIILAPLLIAWNLLSWGIQAGWNNFIKPAWDRLAAGAQFLWTGVLQPIFGLISAGWSALASGIAWWWENVTKPAWAALQSAAQWMWNSVLSPVFGFIKAGWDALSNGIRAAYDSIIKPAWDAVGNALRSLWDNIVSPVVTWIKDKWDDMGRGIRVVYDSVISPAFDALRNGLQRVRDFFGTVVDGIGGVWDRLRGLLAKPINFMIREVYNGGILRAWNTIAKFIPGLNEASPAQEISGYATGGRISGPGTGTSDDVLMWGSNGEHMWTEAEVRKAGGHGAIYAMREMIADGDAFTFDGHGGLVSLPNRTDNDAGDLAGAAPGLFLPAFAKGGEIRPEWETQLERGHEYAQKVAPGPYVFGGSSGGVKGGGTDCSGFMSEIADVILGGPGGTRKWATGSFPGPQQGAWASGLGPGFSVGIVNGGPGGGHTAGTLSGVGNFGSVNVESGGGTGQGATYGGLAVGADHSQFPDKHHLKIGADGAFESGGAGGGPSPAEKSGFLRDKVKDIFDELLNPVKGAFASAIGEPPPEWLAIPPKAMSVSKDKVIDFVFDRIADLGSLLGGAYNKAKDIGSAIADGVSSAASWVGNTVSGLWRDNGGWIPAGRSIVNNETGKPEAVLNWDQVQMIKQMIDNFGLGYNPVAEAEAILHGPTAPAATNPAEVTPESAPTSPQAALQGGTQVAQQVFAEEMGDKSALDMGVDAMFDFFGAGDSLTKKLLTTPANELAPTPEWYGKDQAGTGMADTSTAGVTVEEFGGTPTADDLEVTATVDAESVAPAPVIESAGGKPLVEDLDSIDPDRHKTPDPGEWGQPFFVHEIVRQAQDKGLPAAGAKIGVATALVESGDPMKMWANNGVPESLNYRHDAVGADHDSVGLFQQRQAGWGTLDQRMDPYESAGLFFSAMLSKFPNWQSMDPGAVAQGVQVSAFPDRYNTKMGRADQLVLEAGLHDTGGTLPDGALAVNLSGSPEHVFTDQAMQDFVESSHLLAEAAADLSEVAESGSLTISEPLSMDAPAIVAAERDQPSAGSAGQSDGGITLVINLDGQQVLEKHIDVIEGRVEVNEKDIRQIKGQRRAANAARVLLT